MTAVKMLWGPASIGGVTTANAAVNGAQLSDADNAAGWILCIPQDGSITDIGFNITASAGTPPAYNCGIVTLDTSGRPTTSAYGGSAIKSYTPSGTGWKWVTLDTPATANAGDFAAVHIYPTGTAPDGSNNISVYYTGVCDSGGTGLRYTTVWTATAGMPAMAIKYSGGVIYGMALSSNTIHVTVNSGTTPDEVGAKFQVPAAMTCAGARVYTYGTGFGSAATFDVVLYNSGGTAVATTTVSDKDFVDDNSYVDVYWDSVNLSAATDYRLIIKPTTSTNGNVSTPKWTFESTAALAAIPEGARWQWTERTDAGAWTNTSTALSPIGLWVSDITFSAGATSFEYGYVG